MQDLHLFKNKPRFRTEMKKNAVTVKIVSSEHQDLEDKLHSNPEAKP